MGAYSFKARFVASVEDGSKTHTIRAIRRRNADKPGNTAHLFYAMRTRHCRRLFSAPIVRIEHITIDATAGRVWIDGLELDRSECESLAHRDGFRPLGESSAFDVMMRFWRATHGTDRFIGHVIHWDYNRRVIQ